MVVFKIYLALGWLAWVCSPLAAEPYDRRRIEALARLNQPRLEAVDLEVEAHASLVEQAHKTPNPVIGLNGEAPALRTVSRVQLSLSQALELGGKREARVRVAEAAAEESKARRREAERQLLLEVREAFGELLWAGRRLQLERQALTLAQQQWTLARERFHRGDIPMVEVLELETEVSRRRAAQQLAESELESRRAAMTTWLDLPAAEIQVVGELGTSQALPPLSELLQQAQAQRPDLALVQLAGVRRAAEVQWEEARGVSDLSVQVGVAYDRTYISPAGIPSNGLTGVGSPVASILTGLSLPLPFQDDNSGNIEAARRRTAAAAAEEQALARQVRAQVENAYWAVVANQRSRQTLRDQTLPLASRAVTILEQAYKVRARPLTELLAARHAHLEAERAELEAARQEELALVRLEAATFQELSR